MAVPAGRGLIIHGSGASMALVSDGAADMVLTGPPYFAPETEALVLRAPVREQQDRERAWREVETFAGTLTPVFAEIARVLRPGGALVVQTKDLRYGPFLLPLAGLHWRLLEEAGFGLVTRVGWRKFSARRRRAGLFLRTQQVGTFAADETEDWLVFSHRKAGGLCLRSARAQVTPDEAASFASPMWEARGAGGRARHPHESPAEIVRRFLRLYSEPGDLVVDPFAGGGTTLREAACLGRRAVGYESDPTYCEVARRSLERTHLAQRRKAEDQDEAVQKP